MMTSRKRWPIAMTIGASVACSLSGCSASVFDRSYVGFPPQSEFDLLSPTPQLMWLENGEIIAMSIIGSSSCPAEPKSLTVIDPTSISIRIEATGGPACTADMAAMTYEFRRPEGIADDSTITVDLGNKGTVSLTPTAGS
jgi:hypothetical protein